MKNNKCQRTRVRSNIINVSYYYPIKANKNQITLLNIWTFIHFLNKMYNILMFIYILSYKELIIGYIY